MTKKSAGFTVIEIIVVIILFGLASVLFYSQKNNVESIARDDTRKIAINSIYYSLEEVFYAKNKYYPQDISSDNLKSVDPTLFIDPNGNEINTAESEYSYTPMNCKENKCQEYTLKASLENETDYIKTNRD